MANILTRHGWLIRESDATPEAIFTARRQVLKAAGLFGLALAGGATLGCSPPKDAAIVGAQENPPGANLYPALRDPRFILDRPLTDENYAASYNNFYEFSTFKSGVYKKSARLRTNPWQIEFAGLVGKPRIFEIDELVRALPLDERLIAFAALKLGRWRFRGRDFRCTL